MIPHFFSMQKKYILSFFVCLSLFVCSFTAVSFADTPLYSTTSNGRDINSSRVCRTFGSGVNSNGSVEINVGTAYIDSVRLDDITFDVSYSQYDTGVVCNINYKPMTATYDNQVAVFPITAFDSVTVSFYLPVRNSDLTYSSTYEWVILTIGANYTGRYTDLFLTSGNSTAGVWDNWTSASYLYHHFRIDTRYVNFSNGTLYTGAYSQYSGLQYLTYIAQTLESQLGYNSNILVRTSFALDINYFPDALSFAEREQLQKLDNLSDKLVDVDESINDIKDILNSSPKVPLKPPPQYNLPDTGEDGFLTEADKYLKDLLNYKDSVIKQFPSINDNLFGSSATVIRVFINGSFDSMTYRITDNSTGVDFSPVMTIIYLSFIIGVLAILRG